MKRLFQSEKLSEKFLLFSELAQIAVAS